VLSDAPAREVSSRPAAHPRRLRVVHIVKNLNYGGMERVLADIVGGLDRDRFEPHVLALKYLGRFSEGLDRVATLHVAPPMTRWSMLHPAALTGWLRRLAPDVVHTHSGVWYKASLAARRSGVPLVIHTEHGRHLPDPWSSRLVDRLASRRTDWVVAVSEAVAAYLRSRVVADARRVLVIPNGIATAHFARTGDRLRLRSDLGVNPDQLVIGSIGRLQPVKGYDVMLEAFAVLRDRWAGGQRTLLVLAGDGPERAALEAQATRLGISGSVRLLGWRDDIHDLHAAYDLFCLSSRSEGMSISLLEAMAAGLCPVVTDVGGNAEVLGPELADLLAPSEDPSALALACERVLADPARRADRARAAQQRVRERFDVSQMVHQYQQLYEGVAATR
jgi:glycosyltransferase involved in cell wall biosynthesis